MSDLLVTYKHYTISDAMVFLAIQRNQAKFNEDGWRITFKLYEDGFHPVNAEDVFKGDIISFVDIPLKTEVVKNGVAAVFKTLEDSQFSLKLDNYAVSIEGIATKDGDMLVKDFD